MECIDVNTNAVSQTYTLMNTNCGLYLFYGTYKRVLIISFIGYVTRNAIYLWVALEQICVREIALSYCSNGAYKAHVSLILICK